MKNKVKVATAIFGYSSVVSFVSAVCAGYDILNIQPWFILVALLGACVAVVFGIVAIAIYFEIDIE